jgi:hypothetical protein
VRTLTDAEVTIELGRMSGAWPYGNVLPVKNLYSGDHAGSQRIGVLWKDSEGAIRPVVYYVDIFTIVTNKIKTPEECDFPRRAFENLEALVRSGWVGD